MARELAVRRKSARESEYAAEFEEPQLLTLGIAYEENKRFGGGAYGPFLKKVDRWSQRTLAASLRKRTGWAARLMGIDASVKQIVETLRERGFKSPYLRSYVVARINPVRFHRARKGDDEPPWPWERRSRAWPPPLGSSTRTRCARANSPWWRPLRATATSEAGAGYGS